MAGMTAAQIAKELRAVPKEVEKASRTARLRAGRLARAATARKLKGKLDKPKARVAGKREILWLGANAVAADHIPGAVSVQDGKVSILGAQVSDAFRFNPQTRSSAGDWESADYITMQRTQGKGMTRYMVDFDREAAQVFDEVADQAADIFLEEFDKELRRQVGAS